MPERMVNEADALLAGHGITVLSRKRLVNGIRVEYRRGNSVCGINYYYSSKKGFSVIPAGGDAALAGVVVGLLSGRSEPVPTPAENTGSGTWIGSDEAGKGDYMGPLVVAAVGVDAGIAERIARMGVRDSKLVGKRELEMLAGRIRKELSGRIATVVLMPVEYNRGFDELRRRGKNSLDLLALCHARAVASVMKTISPDRVVVDKFCSENRLKPLMPRGDYSLELRERGESDPAVAAASILARSAYMKGLEHLGKKFGLRAVPGAGKTADRAAARFVDKFGESVLEQVAKVHFRNTSKILDRTRNCGS